MPIVNAIVGGIICGAIAGFIIAFASQVNFLGWANHLVVPAFYVVGVPSGVYLGIKSNKSG